MSIEEFKSSLDRKNPPAGLDKLLLALWYDAKGDWKTSHAIIQDIDTKDAALIHAYLHRKEGDIGNAKYWYSIASVKKPDNSLEDEWQKLVEQFTDED